MDERLGHPPLRVPRAQPLVLSRRAAELMGRSVDDLRLVICHLGAGCSDSAVHGGRCLATTMGFTPLDGLMMGMRSGSIDPSIVLYVQQHHGLTVEQVETALNRESGLLGVSGISGDMAKCWKRLVPVTSVPNWL